MGLVLEFIGALIGVLVALFALQTYLQQPWVSRRLRVHSVGFLGGVIAAAGVVVALIFGLFPGEAQSEARLALACVLLVPFLAGVVWGVRRLDAIEREDRAQWRGPLPGRSRDTQESPDTTGDAHDSRN